MTGLKQTVLTGSLTEGIPDDLPDEFFTTLLDRDHVRIERVISRGHVSPPGFWYDQTEGEWVLVVSGAARLRFQDESEDRALGEGDYMWIAPHRRHRVSWTDPDQDTIWLAVFVSDSGG